MSTCQLKNYLELSYEELEEKNLEAKAKQSSGASEDELASYYTKYLEQEKGIKAVTLSFSDLEGKYHRLDYDKKFLLKSYDNLTFDGSSIRGFTQVSESDLRLKIDWGSFRWLPSDVFGPGKVNVFGSICNKDGSVYKSDMRGLLQSYCDKLKDEHGYIPNIAVECEGFLFEGVNAEQNYKEDVGFKFVSSGGYFNSLSQEPLKRFIDAFADVQRAMGFENEKDHPEVAPSQFELNYSYCHAVQAADQLQLYKYIARQVAQNMGMTACFLPKPISGVNGSGMHTNMSISSREGKNLFFDGSGEEGLSQIAWSFIDRILTSANDLILILDSSVNSYRRLDPNFEAPNQIRSSSTDRTSMIRIPIGNEKSARVEVRVVAPDANPYMAFYALLKTGLEGPLDESTKEDNRKTRTRFLPGNIKDAIRHFKQSEHISNILGQENKDKFYEQKMAAAVRSPRELGSNIKASEVLYHHEVTNQLIWSDF